VLTALFLTVLAAGGPPLFYWGARPALIATEAGGAESRGEGAARLTARVAELHAALDKGSLVLRFTFDRPVREATTLPDGAPVSGRLRATLYVDRDDDRSSGLQEGPADLRTGADLRLEIGVVAVGEDPEEEIAARALISATLASLAPDGRRKTLWRADDLGSPREVRADGEWLELRLPPLAQVSPNARLILGLDDRTLDGRLR
jgi:hypothetical protein